MKRSNYYERPGRSDLYYQEFSPQEPYVFHANCGELRPRDVGKYVEVAGRVYKMLLGRFMQLKDNHGTVQAVVSDNNWELSKRITNLPLQSFITIRGVVCARPKNSCNDKMATGKIEIQINDIVVVKVNRVDSQSTKKNYEHSTSTEITSIEYRKCGAASIITKLKSRQYTCGFNLKELCDKEVTLFGWVEKKTLPKFLQLRDGYGEVQCVLPDNDPNIKDAISQLNPKSVLKITGTVCLRPHARVKNVQHYINGGVELQVTNVEVLEFSDQISVGNGEGVEFQNQVSGECKYTNRSHTCGELRLDHVGLKVRLCGWLKAWRPPRFFTVVDAYGSIQCITSEKFIGVNLSDVHIESIVEVEGIVNARSPNGINDSLPTGQVEVLVIDIKVLNSAERMPFSIDFRPDDSKLYTHRYLSLRSNEFQNNLRMRSTLLLNVRKFLIDTYSFVEIETPILTHKTSEELIDFVVPTKDKNSFYYLPSNHLWYGQMLMTGGFDRYFQLSRCFRNETSKADDQLEFTQLELELCFSGIDDVISLTEDLLCNNFPSTLYSKPFKRMSYIEALQTYGSDEPDISFGLELKDISKSVRDVITNVVDDFAAYLLVIRANEKTVLTNHFNETLVTKINEQFEGITFLHHKIADVKISEDISEDINSGVIKNVVDICALQKSDDIYISYGRSSDACTSLGKCRTLISELLEKKKELKRLSNSTNKPLWITDLPLFSKDRNGDLRSFYHPFTAPVEEDIPLITQDALKVRSLSFKLMFGINKVAMGSVKVHSAELQQQIFKLLKVSSPFYAKTLTALQSGHPPHAGISLDIDRLLAISCNVKTVRDVIAFPKTEHGADLIAGTPISLSQEDLSFYHKKVDSSADDADSPAVKKIKRVEDRMIVI